MEALPQKIGKYEIKSLLGEGATSIVFEGFDAPIKRRVAIKILRENLLRGIVGEELLARFRREATSAARCLHPNIVAILEYGQHGKRPFIVMEYVDGISVHRLIKHRLQRGRGISLRRSLSIISQLLKALHVAHQMHIVHRDVKASNVLILKQGGGIKLADFGMARIADNSDLTMIGSMIGTPRYMAPELRLGLDADPRADLFSAARLLLELLRMLPGSTQIQRSRLPATLRLPPGNRVDYSAAYPSALIPVLARGLASDRSERFQSALEFMLAIKQALPDLQWKTATRARPIEPVVHEPAANTMDFSPPSDDELDSMTALLADFVGPVAKLIMEEHETRSASAHNLAIEIAKEIPEQDQQIEFLQRWETMSRTRQASVGSDRANHPSARREPQPLLRELLDRIGEDFSHYVGPVGKTLMRHPKATTDDTGQLVKSLGRDIPDRKQGRNFVKSWLDNR